MPTGPSGAGGQADISPLANMGGDVFSDAWSVFNENAVTIVGLVVALMVVAFVMRAMRTAD